MGTSSAGSRGEGAAPVVERTVTTHHDGVVERRTWTDEAERYELGDEIASGGGGRVVTARDGRLEREVAVKLPHDEVGSLRLMREAQLMARLEHPSIVSVHDLARDRSGTPFYVMKRLAGETLRERIEGCSFEDRIALLPTLIAIADAVAYAHHRGIVHRDLKPANVIVGEFGETSVIDWGLARVVGGAGGEAPAGPVAGEDVAVKGAVVGTPAYMPPEQARGEPADLRADVYGLGALCYHVLAGEPPFRGASATEVVARVLEGPPPPLAERQPRVPADLAAIIAKAMARDPADRYPSARELAADLRAYQSGRLVAAHRYSPWARLRRWARRHRVALAAGGAAVAAAAAIAIAWPARTPDLREVCAPVAARVASLWTPAAQVGVADRVRASGGPGATTAAGSITERLEAYARSLAAARIDACVAGHVRDDPTTALDPRMTCLDRRTDDLAAAIGLFDHVGPREIFALAHAVEGLPSIERCATPEMPNAEWALPTDPTQRAAAVARYEQIAAGRAHLSAARYAKALEIARAVAGIPGETDTTPYAADAHLLLGSVLQETNKPDAAAPELHRAFVLAEFAHQDAERVIALDRLARNAIEQRQLGEAERRLRELAALATRTGDLSAQARRLHRESELAEARGEYKRSLELQRQSAELAERSGLPVLAMRNLGNLVVMAGRQDEAEPTIRRARDAYEATFGRDHPGYARDQNTLANIYLNTGRAADAIPLVRQAIDRFQRAGLDDAEDLVGFRATLASALAMRGRYDEAEAEVVAVLAALGDDHPRVGELLANLGENRMFAHQPARAERWLRRAVAHTEAHLGASHPRTASARARLALARIEQGDARGAAPVLEVALAIQLREKGPDSADVAVMRVALARAHVELGEPARALEPGEQALAFYAKHPDPRAGGELRWVLARALHAAGGDRAHAIALAEQARADLAKVHDDARVAELDRLLGELRR